MIPKWVKKDYKKKKEGLLLIIPRKKGPTHFGQADR